MPEGSALTDEQFAELKALLQPGFEFSTLMLAEYKAARAAPAPVNESSSLGVSGNAEG